MKVFIYLFACCFLSLDFFQSYAGVTITVTFRPILGSYDIWAAGSLLESTAPTLKQDIRLKNCWWASPSDTITTSFNDLSVYVFRNSASWLKFDINWQELSEKLSSDLCICLQYKLYIIQVKIPITEETATMHWIVQFNTVQPYDWSV